ncbi:MAG: bifunctional acetate--CoA ligase family protein/GNAT family N-acetyltransferase [Nitrososphaerota archaeon]|nr:bifunctional acetate--CoA ligase family protein/GNAT family N-acetyltransferase [Nitrososphaerota archaeon]MDW8040442.1 bifunctional acetate--CoA ligase family protein/GNAT family N-acetyltransferase [Nitrososphaerota archaeon]
MDADVKMVTTYLDKIFNPKSVAVVGASDEEGSVGYALMKNFLESGFEGEVYPVNIRKNEILGVKAYQSVLQLPKVVDLAVIATPAKTVPDVVEQCGKAGIKGLIIISAGFKEVGPEGKALEDKILEIKQKYDLRIIGPNCLGIIRPSIRLNATFINKMPRPGNIAFISQSGALGTAILDWAVHENVGFSHFVSVGSMIDVDFGDLIDYFGTDPKTRSILMYVEGITNARKFMSAARHFARTKPIIVVKAGKYGESARAAVSHTGSLTGEDDVYEAAFKRAGIVRVEEIADLFNCAEVLGMQPLPRGPNLAIITNAGGPGVMATDALIGMGGKLAKLSPQTMEHLNSVLPPYWSHGNPIDILGDARADRYKAVLEAVLNDENVDGILIIYTAQAVANPVEIAKSIVELVKSKGQRGKTVLTSFMGRRDVEEANLFLNSNEIPTFSTPEQAIKTYLYMYKYKRNLELLYETPEELPVDISPPKLPIMAILKNAAIENREVLTEFEAKKILEFYNIPVVKTYVARDEDEAVAIASKIGYPVVLKILSPQIIHKTDAGGVALDLKNEGEVREAFRAIIRNAKKYNATAEILGVTVQPMIKKRGVEVILGSKKDIVFGPVILFGMGGVGVELFKDYSVGLPPLNQTLARRMMEETKVYQLLKGFRGMSPANIKRLEEVMVLFSHLLVDFPQIKEIDINPLIVDEKDVIAIDARIIIDKELVFKKAEPHQHMVISPYPKKYETLWKMRDGRTVLLRPIKPEDEPLWLEMFQNCSEESIRYKLSQTLKHMPHEVRVRYCNIDYDREIAIVAELTENGKRKIIGTARVSLDPDGKSGELAFLVADPWQGLGLGTKLVDYVIEICRERGLETIYALMVPENLKAIELMKKFGFTLKYTEEGVIKGTLTLKEDVSLTSLEKLQEVVVEAKKPASKEKAKIASMG